jgi:hypothetical protein
VEEGLNVQHSMLIRAQTLHLKLLAQTMLKVMNVNSNIISNNHIIDI